MRKKSVSLLLVFTFIFTSVSFPVFSEKLTYNSDEENKSSILQIFEDGSSSSLSEDEKVISDVLPEATNNIDENNEDITLNADGVINLNTQLESGAYTIEADGQYELSISTNYNIIVKSGVTAELTLTNASITSTGAAPIKIESGAVLTLHIEGENTLTAPNYYAGIAVYANDTSLNYGTLIIDGSGTLNVKGGTSHGAGIGTNKRGTDASGGISGKIIINGGTINATGGNGGAGIGASYGCTACGDIEINGGIVNAAGGKQAAGIGGTGTNPNGRITINGGSVNALSGTGIAYGIGPGSTSGKAEAVIINGGSVNAVVSPKCPPTDKLGTELRKIILQMPNGTEMANKEVMVDSWTASTDENGKLYPYVGSDITSFAVNYNNKVYYTTDIDSEQSEYILTEYSGPLCSCTEGNASVTLDMPDVITVNKLTDRSNTKLVSTFHAADGCTYPIHTVKTDYQLTIDSVTPPDSSLAQISDGYLVTYYAAAGKTIHLEVTAEMDGKQYAAEKDIEITGDNTTKFDISKGNITISAHPSDSTMINVTHGLLQYTILKTSTVYIEQSELSTANTITVQGVDARVALKDVNINTVLSNPITIGDSVNLTLELIGNNTIHAQSASAVQGILSTSELTVDGSGSLDITSGVGAGIGNIKTLTVNGGTIVATGGSEGAGIGGGRDGSGREVIINNGRVYAYGDGNAAGIGGGASQSAGGGGSFTINGGMVVARSTGSGKGIGYGGKTNEPGTITVNGGSVNADLAVRPTESTQNKYLVKLNVEGISEQTDVTYTIGDDNSNPISTSTDENGQLYLYMTAGKQWIRVYKDGNIYYRYMTVVSADTNEGICIANPAARINTFEVAGQIGESEIDNVNMTINVTVPYNIMLSRITPIVTYDGCETTSGMLNFDNSEHTSKFMVYSDDKKSKEYTVKLILANEPAVPQADIYDISKGSLIIMGDYVRYGGTYYVTNNLGYVITGSTSENSVSIDYSEQALPPITIRDLNINSTAQTVPFKVNESANINVEGICNIVSAATKAVDITNAYGDDNGVKLNVTGTGVMNITGGGSNPAVYLNNSTSMNITGTATSLTGGTGENALNGTGEFITDSTTAMKIVSADNPVIQPKTVDGTPLYQLTAHIKTDDKSSHTCEYNNKSYYIWDDASLYLMVPNNEYIMTVQYNGLEYDGKVTVNGASAEVTLSTISVDNVVYDNTPLTYKGGIVEFTVTGHLVADNVIIRLKPNDSSLEVLEGTVKEADGVNKVSITLPENKSYEKAVTYTVYSVIRNEETEWNKKIQVSRNNTSCDITSFAIDKQVGETSITSSGTLNIITIYMPYDHVFEAQKYYTPSITYSKGSSISPAEGPAQFTRDVNGYMRARYTVTAEDNSTTKSYEVRLYKNPTPSLKTLNIQGTLTSDGGKVTVIVRGTSTNSIQYAENPDNQNVYIYADGIEPVKATMQMNNGVAEYIAEINVPANTSYTEDAEYILKARIGSMEQTDITSNNVVTVPRQKRGLTGINRFSVPGQVGATDMNSNKITLTMPYDADITSITPSVALEDLYASYSPIDAQDFTSDVKYTVTAENGAKQEYIVHINKQKTPVATSIEFANPSSSGAGRVAVIVKGQNLENAANAMNSSPNIQVSGTLASGESGGAGITSANAVLDDSGNYVAAIVVPTNNSYTPKIYTLQVIIGGTVQTLTGNINLTVPARKSNSNDITDVIITENQDSVIFSEPNIITVPVPYNTDLRSVTPEIYHNGVSYTPQGAQNFNNPVNYTVIAENGDRKEYIINTQRKGSPEINNITVHAPADFQDTKVTVDISGQFIPYITDKNVKDVITISAVSRDDNSIINGTVEYDSNIYAGYAKGTIVLPENNSGLEKVYDVKVYLNNNEQSGLAGVITVPRRTTRQITEFTLPDVQVGDTRIEGTDIYIDVPYIYDISSVTPVIKYDADKITPEGAQDFSDLNKPVQYILSSSGDDDVTYTIHIKKLGEDPRLTSMTVENQADKTVYSEENKVTISLPTGSKLESIEPVIEFVGLDYSPKGPQNFTNSVDEPVVYTFVNEYNIEKKYYVTIEIKKEEPKKGGSRRKPTPTPTVLPTAEPTQQPVSTPEVSTSPKPEKRTKPYINGYEENGVLLFKPDNAITRAEVAAILIALDEEFKSDVVYSNMFFDIDNNAWYKNYINFAVSKGYISGYDDGSCRPENMITRAEFAAIIARYMNITSVDGEDRFRDISNISWCRTQINALYDMGIVSGYDNGVFYPENMITRAEATAIINRMLNRKMTDDIFERILCPFEDITNMHWAYNDVLLASCEY